MPFSFSQSQMRDVNIFQMVRDLTPPWQVAASAFSPEKRRLDLRLSLLQR